MKKVIKYTIAVFMLLTYTKLLAQQPKEISNSDVDGLYLSQSDFKHGKLSRPTDKQHNGDKIKLKQFFISPDIISIEQDKNTVFYKDSIFAIHLTNGENYRFINRTPYLVADTSFLYIYAHNTTKTEFEISGPRTIRREVPITYYYFSTGNHESAFMLNLENIRLYALNDTIVHKNVCNKFTSDEMLQKMNSETGRFVLNETIISIFKE